MIKVIVVIFIVLAAAGYYVLQNGIPDNIPIEILSTKINRKLAVENVKKLPEVQEYLKEVPNGKVEVDNELAGEYNVHVYEVKNGHTATFNWYRVGIKSGEVRSEKGENTGSSKITTEQARMVVQNLPEVQNYLKEVPNGKVEVDNEQEGEYNVQVFEVKNGHTATFNWYTVDIKTGRPVAQFDSGKAEETSTARGTVNGKLCYPSEVIPEGVIEAKRLSDGKVFILDYGGSESGESNIYEFPLENGEYYLRYKTKGNLMGYSTTVCPTGKEESCGDTKIRILKKTEVKTGVKVSDYDLCDYYYKDSNAPKF